MWLPSWHCGTHQIADWGIYGLPETPAPNESLRTIEFRWPDKEELETLQEQGALRGDCPEPTLTMGTRCCGAARGKRYSRHLHHLSAGRGRRCGRSCR